MKFDFIQVIAIFNALWYRALVDVVRRRKKNTKGKMWPLFPAVYNILKVSEVAHNSIFIKNIFTKLGFFLHICVFIQLNCMISSPQLHYDTIKCIQKNLFDL